MIKLLDKDNVDPQDSENPYGFPRDRDGLIAGTKGNTKNFADLLTLMDKLMDSANITPNGLHDSDYSGWQIFEAIQFQAKNARNYDRLYMKLTQTSTNAPSLDDQAENDLGVSGILSRTGAGDYRLTMPAGTFPNQNKVYIWTNSLSTPGGSIVASLSGDTILRIRTYDATDTLADGLLNKTDIILRRYS